MPSTTYHVAHYGDRPLGTGWRRVWERTEDGAAFPLVLYQKGTMRYAVVYGKEVAECVGYVEVCRELGRALMHSLNCEGHLLNGGS